MRRFKSARHLQREQMSNLFMHGRYNTNAQHKHEARTQAFDAWERASCAPMLGRLAA
jgi:putative transposase